MARTMRLRSELVAAAHAAIVILHNHRRSLSRSARRSGSGRPVPVLAGAAAVAAGALLASACANENTRSESESTMSATTSKPSTATQRRTVNAAGTTFAVELRGDGPSLLVIHGGGEDAAMMAPLAERLAASGRRVITYDRRGTGASGRDDWPGSGARQHADDAAALLRALHVDRAQVLGLSSGGIIALELAIRHPSVVGRTFVWEAPAVGVVPGGKALNTQVMAPIERHLARHPGDFVGAQAILLSAVLGSRVTVDDPRFAGARANAEPMIRDEPAIALQAFSARELADLDVTIAVGTAPNEIVDAASRRLSELTGRPPVVVDTDDHEIYLTHPRVLADVVTPPAGPVPNAD